MAVLSTFDKFSSFVADTPFAQVKLAELPAWLGRRNKDPLSMVRAFGRCKYYQFTYFYNLS